MPDPIRLRGTTWAHERGLAPMVATATTYASLAGVEIAWTARTLQEFGSRSVTQLAEEYDLLVIDHPHIGDAQRDDALMAFEPRSELDEAIGPSGASYVLDGQTWALPIDAAAQISGYRPDLLPESDVPTTWAGVIELARSGTVLWPLMPVDAVCSYLSLAASSGTPAVAGGRFIAAEHSAAVLELMRSVSSNLDPRCFDQDPIDALDLLATADSFRYIPLAFGYSNYSRAGFAPIRLRAADMPSVGPGVATGSLLGGAGIAVSSSSSQRDAAMRYAEWVASPDVQRGEYVRSGGQPAAVAAWEDDAANDLTDGFFRRTQRTLERSWLRPRDIGFPAWQDEAGLLINAFVRGERSLEQSVDALEVAFDALVTR